MIDIDIPGFGRLRLAELVCDYNGTIARDGQLVGEASALLASVAKLLHVQVVTADTFATARGQLAGLPCELVVLETGDQALAKAAFVEHLGAERVVAIGNGRNDRLMLASAALGIGVIGDEGAAAEAVSACNIVTRHIADALTLLLEPRRLVATLRD